MGGIEQVGSDPGDAGEEENHQRRDRPDDEFHAPGIGPGGQVTRTGVRGAKPPGKCQRRQYRWNDDGQHDCQRIEQNGAIGRPDRSRWRKNSRMAACERQRPEQAHAERADPILARVLTLLSSAHRRDVRNLRRAISPLATLLSRLRRSRR